MVVSTSQIVVYLTGGRPEIDFSIRKNPDGSQEISKWLTGVMGPIQTIPQIELSRVSAQAYYDGQNSIQSAGQRLPRITTASYSATVTPNADTTDALNVAPLTGNITIANPTGNPSDWQSLLISMSASGDNRTATFGSSFQIPSSSSLNNSVSIQNGTESVFAFRYKFSTGKWRFVSVIPGY
jgi:hypothetical protein